MARHLIHGEYHASSITAGKWGIEKRTPAAQNAVGYLAVADFVGAAPEIRFVMNDATHGWIRTPWIGGKNVISVLGFSAAGQAASTVTSVLTTNATADLAHNLKIINLTSPSFEFFNFDISSTAGGTPTVQTGLMHDIIDPTSSIATGDPAYLPNWVKSVADGGGTLTVTGWKKGEVMHNGEVCANGINLGVADNMDGSNGTTCANTVVGWDQGAGDGFYMNQFESDIRGTVHGDYSRAGTLPMTPAATIATGSNYDTFVIVATKDGSTTSGINGVDNLIEIVMADTDLSGAAQTIVNDYCDNTAANGEGLGFAALAV